MFLGLKAPRALPQPPQTHRPACFSRSLGLGVRSVRSVTVRPPKCKGIAKQIARLRIAAHQRDETTRNLPRNCKLPEFCITRRAGSYAGACGCTLNRVTRQALRCVARRPGPSAARAQLEHPAQQRSARFRARLTLHSIKLKHVGDGQRLAFFQPMQKWGEQLEAVRPSPFQPSDLKPSFSPAKSRFQDTCKNPR